MERDIAHALWGSAGARSPCSRTQGAASSLMRVAAVWAWGSKLGPLGASRYGADRRTVLPSSQTREHEHRASLEIGFVSQNEFRSEPQTVTSI
jgi:hypothetical protein